MQLKPMPGYIVVQPIDKEAEKVQGTGIVLAQTREKGRPTEGKVIYTTSEDRDLKNKTVLFDMYGSHEINFEGQELLIVSLYDLVGVLQ